MNKQRAIIGLVAFFTVLAVPLCALSAPPDIIISKSVTPETLNLFRGDSGTVTYTVSVELPPDDGATFNVVDTNGPSWTFSDSAEVTYEETFTCDEDEGTHPNTATIVETGQSASATVTVNCYDLEVTKDTSTSFTRTYSWSIDKSADQTDLNLPAGQQSPVNYQVVLDTTGYTDSDWTVSGNISVNNPAPIGAILNSVSDDVSGVGASVDCGVSFPYELAGGATLSCTYSAALPDSSSGTNTATATLENTPSGTTDFSGVAPFVFGSTPTNEVDECVNVDDTYAGVLGTACITDIPPKAFTYSRDVGPYSACGDYTVDNTATFTTNDTGATGDDSWSVLVHVLCQQAICRTAGFWGTHAGTECKKKEGDCGSQNITQTVISDECDESCLEICGEAIRNTDLDSGDSALEAMCVSPAGDQRLQLARQLTATSLNCCTSVNEGDCEGLDVWSDLFNFCNSVCTLNQSDSFSYCIQALDCLNKGGNPITLPGDPLTVFCQTGTCRHVDGIIPLNNNLTLLCNDEIACLQGIPTIVDGPDPIGIVCRPLEDVCTECVPFEETCHTRLLGVCDDGSICTEENTMGTCKNGDSCDAQNPCADFSECQSICDSDDSVCKPGPAGSSNACTTAIGDGKGKNSGNDCAVLPKASSDDCSKFNQGEECCANDSEDVCEPCDHDLCEIGPGLDLFCDPCVTAVCLEDPSCCDDENGVWNALCVQKVNTICGLDLCPTIPEGEACGEDTNGGCNSSPPAFGSIACGQTIAGTAWADGGTRDTDWFAIDLPDTGGNGQEVLTVSLVSDFEGVTFIVTGGAYDCSGPSVLEIGCSNDGALIQSATATLSAPGTYTVFVATGMCDGGGIFDGYPCDGGEINYTLTVDCSDTAP